MGNLKAISLACMMYADDHDGRMLSDLGESIKPYINNDGRVLQSPRAPKGFDGPHYIYVRVEKMKDLKNPSRCILAYENPAYCTDRINAAFYDGHVESWIYNDTNMSTDSFALVVGKLAEVYAGSATSDNVIHVWY